MIKTKDQEFLEYKIKISKIRNHFMSKDGNHHKYKDKLICIEIDDKLCQCKTSTCFEYSNKGKQELLKFIQNECGLRQIENSNGSKCYVCKECGMTFYKRKPKQCYLCGHYFEKVGKEIKFVEY